MLRHLRLRRQLALGNHPPGFDRTERRRNPGRLPRVGQHLGVNHVHRQIKIVGGFAQYQTGRRRIPPLFGRPRQLVAQHHGPLHSAAADIGIEGGRRQGTELPFAHQANGQVSQRKTKHNLLRFLLPHADLLTHAAVEGTRLLAPETPEGHFAHPRQQGRDENLLALRVAVPAARPPRLHGRMKTACHLHLDATAHAASEQRIDQ